MPRKGYFCFWKKRNKKGISKAERQTQGGISTTTLILNVLRLALWAGLIA